MSYKMIPPATGALALALALLFMGSAGLSAQHTEAASAFGPTRASVVLLEMGHQPETPMVAEPFATFAPPPGIDSGSFLTEALVLAGASFGGLWAGRQIPFDPADDDSDLSEWHFLTAPVASAAAVAVTSVLLGNRPSSSVSASVVGAGAGLVAAIAVGMVATDDAARISYAAVHGLVAAWRAR